ncbi:unnamed protein product [Allacma fusca]|uniref:cholesterol 7-desaturase n=1 Tax=Allacma fusca TaxID=39272 RepID=A0A8J2NS28_9HEXA|nr:unnamed protein product [Allacma fusca]
MLTVIYIIVFIGILLKLRTFIFKDVIYIPPGFEDCLSGNISKKRATLHRLKQQREIGSIPPHYPNGWFALLESQELKRGTIVDIHALGLHLVAWRADNTGSAQVSNADCSCGANLAKDGSIVEDVIVCSSHGHDFNLEQSICGLKSEQRSRSDTEMFTILERNGFLYLWYHAEGLEPHYYPEEFEEILTGRWKCRARARNELYAHIQDIRENEADVNHFAYTHKDGFALGLKSNMTEWSIWRIFDFTNFEFEGHWTPGENKHQSVLILDVYLCLFGRKICKCSTFRNTATGLGIFILNWSNILVDMKLLICYTPVGPMKLQGIKRLYCSPWIPSLFVSYIMTLIEANSCKDARVWNRKTHIRSPCLTAEDSCIKGFRTWCLQFYSM